MLRYTFKRIITFIPMMIAISLLAFIISINAPGDPVDRLVKSDQDGGANANTAGSNNEQKEKVRRELGLHLPIFYFTISDYATPNNLHTISNEDERENLKELIHKYGNWSQVKRYYESIKSTQTIYQEKTIYDIYEDGAILSKSDSNNIAETWNQIGMALTKMLEENNEDVTKSNLSILTTSILDNNNFEHLEEGLNTILKENYELEKKSTKWKRYIPSLHFYGVKNQYHLWLFGNGKDREGILRGDFGKSYNDGQLIKNKIWDRIGISFSLSLISILIAYLISIPLGIYSAYQKDSPQDRTVSVILFILYSLPSFFVGTLLLLWFSNPDNLYWFPESGIQNPITWDENWKWYEWQALEHRIPYLVLPLITYTYGSFAFLSRIMRIGMIEVVGQDYIRTARAKGLSEKVVILKHALRNSLLPIITVFAAVFPVSVGGSIIIEYIFTIPGMGLEIFNAIQNQDYPMIITFFTLAGFLTMIGYLVADILYAVADPRISYK